MSSIKPLHAAISLLKALREIDPYIPTQTAECLLVVAQHPGITMQKLSDETGLAQSSCSRNVAMLSKFHRLGKPGYDLVEAVDDPRERRRKIVYLTPHGRKLVNTVMKNIDPAFNLEAPTAREALTRMYSAGAA
jgi:DNA-binding MarR family transcriptional regulator